MDGKKINCIKRYVRGVLKAAGKWSPEMAYQVELLASDLLLFRELRDDVERHGATIVETSREGFTRTRLRPSVPAMREQAKAVREDLKVLLMNRALDREEGAAAGDELLARLMEN